MSGESDIFVEDRLFATLDPLTRDISVGENQKVLLTDTVGFIRNFLTIWSRASARRSRKSARPICCST